MTIGQKPFEEQGSICPRLEPYKTVLSEISSWSPLLSHPCCTLPMTTN